jgi:hypothetical protein
MHKEGLVHSGRHMMSVWDMSNKLTLVIALIAVVAVMTALSTTQVQVKKHSSDLSCSDKGFHDGNGEFFFRAKTFEKCGDSYQNGFVQGCDKLGKSSHEECQELEDAQEDK